MNDADHILLVEDDAVVSFAIADYLGHAGFRVTVARTAAAAHGALQRGPFAIVIADLRLGGTESHDGFDVVTQALRDRSAAHAVILTAYGDDAMVTRAAVLGVDAVVKKPVPLVELVGLLRNLLGASSETEQ